MRLHVPSLPHTSTTDDFSWCAYTSKVKKFCTMMTRLGYEVILYGGPNNDAEVAEHVVTSTFESNGITDIPPFDAKHPVWDAANRKNINAIRSRANKEDILCIIGGLSQKTISDNIPELLTVEWGIGYSGVYSKFKVFESYAWMHAIYAQMHDAAQSIGNFYDTVIPNYFDVDQFPEGDGSGDYLFYIGRLIPLKGLQVVADVAERTGLPLIIAGSGDKNLVPKNVAEYYPFVKPEQRAELLGNARCTLVPTMYVEPFGGVNVESQLTGTPVLTTDWGAFTETVQQGVSGYRCHDLGEFEWAVDAVKDLDRKAVRANGMKYDQNVLAHDYDEYFQRLGDVVSGKGWYTDRKRAPRGCTPTPAPSAA